MAATAAPAAPMPPLIVIAGATATGKTALAIEIAERLGSAEIVSADSRQVYRGMDIGTAKVSAADRSRVPHHGLDLVDPDEPFSVADYQRHAVRALAGIASRGGTAILAGGTGLYIRAVARGLALLDDPSDAAVRATVEADLERDGVRALAAELQRRAPTAAAGVDLANPRRVARALERARIAGDRPPPLPAGYPSPVLWLGLRVGADQHREWITARAAAQFASGLVDEARDLSGRYGRDLRPFSAFGYREAMAAGAGEISKAAALAETIRRTTAYARRQRTWFRSEPGIEWLDAGPDAPAIAAERVRSWVPT